MYSYEFSLFCAHISTKHASSLQRMVVLLRNVDIPTIELWLADELAEKFEIFAPIHDNVSNTVYIIRSSLLVAQYLSFGLSYSSYHYVGFILRHHGYRVFAYYSVPR